MVSVIRRVAAISAALRSASPRGSRARSFCGFLGFSAMARVGTSRGEGGQDAQSRVPDAVRHSSCRSAEPGPYQAPAFVTIPVLRSSASQGLRAASRPGNGDASKPPLWLAIFAALVGFAELTKLIACRANPLPECEKP